MPSLYPNHIRTSSTFWFRLRRVGRQLYLLRSNRHRQLFPVVGGINLNRNDTAVFNHSRGGEIIGCAARETALQTAVLVIARLSVTRQVPPTIPARASA